MNFGNTIEEQYATVCAINRKCEQFTKIVKYIMWAMSAGYALACIAGAIATKNVAFIVIAVIGVLILLFYSKKLGNIYCWSWILLCDKYDPAYLAKSFADATHNSAAYGYRTGGSKGAQQASLGTVAFIFIFAVFQIGKGAQYAKKYSNLPQAEIELKKQLDAKYGTAQ